MAAFTVKFDVESDCCPSVHLWAGLSERMVTRSLQRPLKGVTFFFTFLFLLVNNVWIIAISMYKFTVSYALIKKKKLLDINRTREAEALEREAAFV